MRIAKGDYYDPPMTPKVFSAEDYDTLVVMLKNRLLNKLGDDDVSKEFSVDVWESYFLVNTNWASTRHATGSDFRRAFKQVCDELTAKIIDVPEEVDPETGEVVVEEEYHHDYKIGETFYEEAS